MAGASTSGQCAARAVTLSKLSPMPCASLAMVLATSRGDHQQISAAVAQPDMGDMAFAAPQIGFHVGLAAGDRLEGERGDELCALLGQDHIHNCARLVQPGGQIGGFVSCDRTGDTQDDMFYWSIADCGMVFTGSSPTACAARPGSTRAR